MKKLSRVLAIVLVLAMVLPGVAQAATLFAEDVYRIEGSNRYNTAAKASEYAYDEADTVVLATGGKYVDALAGTVLAARENAPLLLTGTETLAKAVLPEIERLGAKKVIILGGVAAVSAKVEAELEAEGLTVERVAGDTGFETAVKLAGKEAKKVYLVSSQDFKDALAIGPVAGMEDAPILLTRGDILNSKTKAALKDLGVEEVVVVGGTSAVSAAVYNEVKGLVKEINRIEGKNGIYTALEVAKEYFPKAKKVFVATNQIAADGLVGGYLGALNEAPVLLTHHQVENADVQKYIQELGAEVVILGGPAAVSNKVAEAYNEEGEGLKVVSVSAIDVNTLKVSLNNAVEEAEVKVLKGKTDVAVDKTEWSSDKKVATITTAAKMTKGEYTVVVKAGEVEATGTIEIKDQETEGIVILNDIALTEKETITGSPAIERSYAYIYYDVVDQYGKSVRNTTNVQWTSSVGGDVTSKANRRTGQIRLERDNQQFVFGEKIFISGVDTKTGKSVQHELTVGQPRALDKIEIAGFVKKGTSEIVKQLPSGFKKDTYQMIFTAVDQNGNKYSESIAKEDLTFISDNPLLIEKVEAEVLGTSIKTITVNGVEYATALVQPGMYIERGGEANIRVISSKTGNETKLNVKIGDMAILTEFNLLQPEGIVAEDETITIPFTAYDQNGEVIKNFTVLAAQESLNALTFNSGSDGSLTLSENADGTATLKYSQATASAGWDKSKATDGVVRPVSLTSIVTGGNASTLMLSIEDKARPEAIKSVKIDNILVKEGSTTVKLTGNKSGDDKDSFIFLDQYGREMKQDKAYDFFNASAFVSGRDFEGYKYSIKATYKGQGDEFTQVTKNDEDFEIKPGSGTNTFTLTAKNVASSVRTGMAIQFEIVRFKTADAGTAIATRNTISVSPLKVEGLTVVDIENVKNFEIKELAKLYVNTNNSNRATGAGLSLYEGTVPNETPKAAEGANVPTQSKKEVKVIGTYNGKEVTIPIGTSKNYVQLTSNQFDFDSAGKKIDSVKGFAAAAGATSATLGTAQVVEATITAGAGTAAGNITVTVTAAGMTNSPKTVTVNVEHNDDIETVLGKIVVALNADDDVKAFFTASAKADNATLVLTAKTNAANDTTMSIGYADNTSPTGVAIESSSITTVGEAPTPLVPATPQVGFAWIDLYNEATANYLRKDAKASIKATVVTSRDSASNPVTTDTASRTVYVSDAAPVATTIVGPEELVVNPTQTGITVTAIEAEAKEVSDKNYLVKDQYGETMTNAVKSYNVSKVIENKDGYVENNFKISSNSTGSLSINGAERGDTFTLTITSGGASLTVQVTVGADVNAKIADGTNSYLITLVNGLNGLEAQRRATLN